MGGQSTPGVIPGRPRGGCSGSSGLAIGGVLRAEVLQEADPLDHQRLGGRLHLDRDGAVRRDAEVDDLGGVVLRARGRQRVDLGEVLALGPEVRVRPRQRRCPGGGFGMDLGDQALGDVEQGDAKEKQADDRPDDQASDEASFVVVERGEGASRIHRRTLAWMNCLIRASSCIRNAAAAEMNAMKPATTPPPTWRSWGPRESVPRTCPTHLETANAAAPVRTPAAMIWPRTPRRRRPSSPPSRFRRITAAIAAANVYAVACPKASPSTFRYRK